MKSKEWYQKQFGVSWQQHYSLDKLVESEKRAAVQKAKANQKKIAQNARREDARTKKLTAATRRSASTVKRKTTPAAKKKTGRR